MNYRHGYHAGNFADVVKHVALIAILCHLKKKDAPFAVIDSHAGRGLYDLGGGEAAAETGEARAASGGCAIWRRRCRRRWRLSGNCRGSGARTYPGSPLIAAQG